MQEIEKILNTWKEKNIIVKQEGFIESKYKIEKLSYKIEYEVLSIFGKEDESYIKINLNQVYQIEKEKNEIKLYLDNDICISLKLQQ